MYFGSAAIFVSPKNLLATPQAAVRCSETVNHGYIVAVLHISNPLQYNAEIDTIRCPERRKEVNYDENQYNNRMLGAELFLK